MLYTIVAGLALSDGISAVLGADHGSSASAFHVLLLLVAFVVTLIPFFHGALRHLDDVYLLDPSGNEVRRGALAVDFGFLFLEGCVLVALAHRLRDTSDFALLLALLLIVDAVWAIISHLLSPASRRLAVELRLLFTSGDRHLLAQLTWAGINLLTFPVILGYQFLVGPALDTSTDVDRLVLLLVSLVRTALDYRYSWDFYFPPPMLGAPDRR